MSEEERLKSLLKTIELLAKERMQDRGINALDALREAFNQVQGELTGY